GLAPSTVKMMHRLLVQAFRQAVKWQLIARNPVDAVSAPRVERRQMRVLDTDGAAAYLAAARGHEMFVPIMLGVLCGLRRGEIAALGWQGGGVDAGRLAVTGSVEVHPKIAQERLGHSSIMLTPDAGRGLLPSQSMPPCARLSVSGASEGYWPVAQRGG